MSSASDLACVELVELVTAYLERALEPDERAAFEEHLVICPGCTTYLEQMRETIRLAGTLEPEEAPPAVRDALRRTFREWHGRTGT